MRCCWYLRWSLQSLGQSSLGKAFFLWNVFFFYCCMPCFGFHSSRVDEKSGKTLKGPNFEKSLRFTLIRWEHSLILSEYFSGLCSAPETCHGFYHRKQNPCHATKNFWNLNFFVAPGHLFSIDLEQSTRNRGLSSTCGERFPCCLVATKHFRQHAAATLPRCTWRIIPWLVSG